MFITINVTQEDIKDGKACGCRTCPVALAMVRVLGYEPPQLYVCSTAAGFMDKAGEFVQTRFPSTIELFIKRFDNWPVRRRTTLAPFTATLEFSTVN